MRIWEIGNRGGQSGITLIEVLVVIVLIGLVAGVTLLSLPSDSLPTEKLAQSIAREIRQARNIAISRQIYVGLQETSQAPAYYEYMGDGWKPLHIDQRVSKRHLKTGLEVKVTSFSLIEPGTIGGDRFSGFFDVKEKPEDPDTAPAILFHPTGEITPFCVRIAGPNSISVVKVTGDARITLEMDREI